MGSKKGDYAEYTYSRGMTLRDYFAGQAIVGLCAAGWSTIGSNGPRIAYEIADAMMKERERKDDD